MTIASQPTRAVASSGRPCTQSAVDVALHLDTDLQAGLGSRDAAERLEAVGPNELDEGARMPAWRLLVHQFTNTMILVLAAAGAVTFFIGERTDTVVIVVIVLLNGVVGFVQEYRAEQAVAALKQLATTTVRVVRDGGILVVPAPELVPGDLVRLAAGDVVPADLRLVDVQGLRVDEAALTGESEPTAKTVDALPEVGASLLGDQTNMAFKGTAGVQGRATGVVVATGMATELGRIAALLSHDPAASTPLQKRLASLGRRLAAAAVVVCAVVFGAGLARGEPTEEMFLTAVSLAVAAIPEGLPAVVTVALALGARRMAARRVVIRRLPAVETLGSVTVICTDKTGTLTENRMTVERVWTPAGTYTVTGIGYSPAGDVDGAGRGADPFLSRLASVAASCNDAVLRPPAPSQPEWTLVGDPTEGALLALAGRLGVERSEMEARRPRCGEIGFDASRRRMTTIHRADDGYWVAIKGALGALFDRVHPDDAAALGRAREAADALADNGYRILALAERWVDVVPADLGELEAELRLVGLVAIADPPRAEVADAVTTCRAAGMTPVMITGDHAGTAAAIARRLGILTSDGVVLTGAELDHLDADALAERVSDIQVYARTNPEQKLRIVDAWRARGAVVAMTGDGVNDAPALQRADIGVAMGITGTDVSKEAAAMILADDNFATIVDAVEEGRRIYDNLRRFVRYLLSTNAGEILIVLAAPLFGLPVPLTAAQILWINLVTDGLPAIALGVEPVEEGTMRRPPRPQGESILARGLWQHALWVGVLMAAIVIPLQAVSRAADWPWQTMVFITVAFLQLGHALAVRSEHQSLFRLGLRTNWWLTGAIAASAVAQLATLYVPPLQSAFGTERLDVAQLAVVAVLSTLVLAAVELEKSWRRRRTFTRSTGVRADH